MLKLVLKRFVLSKAPITRGYKSKSALGNDEDIESRTPNNDDQLDALHSLRDSSTSLIRGSYGFKEFSLPRHCRGLVGVDPRLLAGGLKRGETRARSLIHVRPLFLQSLQVGTHAGGQRQPDFDSLRSETARLQTYRNWQNPTITARALAKNGFYFTGSADAVQCVFCLGVLDGWNADDADEVPVDQYPSYRHRHQLPHCPFVRGFDVQNISDGDQDVRLEDHRRPNELQRPVQESADPAISDIMWNAACRAVFVGVQLRPSSMPFNWALLGVHLRDPNLEFSLTRLAQVNANNPDIRRRFAAMLSHNMAVRHRTGTGSAQYLGNLGVASRDNLLHDVIHLEHSVNSVMLDALQKKPE